MVRCELCGVDMSGPENIKTHYEGRKHKMKEAAMLGATQSTSPPSQPQPSATSSVSVIGGVFHCSACDTSICGQANWDIHRSGRKHKNKVGAAPQGTADEAPPVQPVQTVPPTVAPSGDVFHCSACDTSIYGQANWDIHRNGRKHKNKLREGGFMETPTLTPLAPTVPPQPSDTFHCDVCATDVQGRDNWEIHLAGRKHIHKSSLVLVELTFSRIYTRADIQPSILPRQAFWREDPSVVDYSKTESYEICVQPTLPAPGQFCWYPQHRGDTATPTAEFCPLLDESFTVVNGHREYAVCPLTVSCTAHYELSLEPEKSLKLIEVSLCGRWFELLFGARSVSQLYRQALADSNIGVGGNNTEAIHQYTDFIFPQLEPETDDEHAQLREKLGPRWALDITVKERGEAPGPSTSTRVHISSAPDLIQRSYLAVESSRQKNADAVRLCLSAPFTFNKSREQRTVDVEVTLKTIVTSAEFAVRGTNCLDPFKVGRNVDMAPVCKLYGVPC